MTVRRSARPPTTPELERRAADYLRTVADGLVGHGLGAGQVTVAIRSGEPIETIRQAAVDAKCDLVIMATHGRSGLERQMLGSVAGGVLRAGVVPVTMVRPERPKLSLQEEERAFEAQLAVSC